jgi:hypothetical protein
MPGLAQARLAARRRPPVKGAPRLDTLRVDIAVELESRGTSATPAAGGTPAGM